MDDSLAALDVGCGTNLKTPGFFHPYIKRNVAVSRGIMQAGLLAIVMK